MTQKTGILGDYILSINSVNLGGLAEHKNSNFENIYILVMIRYQHYGSETHIVRQSTSQSNFITTFVVILNGFECFQDGRQIKWHDFNGNGTKMNV